jgi:hypothetical protein
VTVVVCVLPPPVAVMVMVWLPKPAFLDAVICRFEEPEPGAAMVREPKLTVRPEPVDAESDTAELKASVPVVLTVVELDPFRLRLTFAGEAATAKSATGVTLLTISDTVVLCVVEPLVPVMVML